MSLGSALNGTFNVLHVFRDNYSGEIGVLVITNRGLFL